MLSALADDTEFRAPGVSASAPSLAPAPSSASAPTVDDGILQSLITQVKDLLPHLGEGFIEVSIISTGLLQLRKGFIELEEHSLTTPRSGKVKGLYTSYFVEEGRRQIFLK